MKKNITFKLLFIILLVIVLFFFTGCMKNKMDNKLKHENPEFIIEGGYYYANGKFNDDNNYCSKFYKLTELHRYDIYPQTNSLNVCIFQIIDDNYILIEEIIGTEYYSIYEYSCPDIENIYIQGIEYINDNLQFEIYDVTNNNSINILFIGNSLSRDAVSYLPYILEENNSNINYKIGISYIGQGTIRQHLNNIMNESPCEAFDIYTSYRNKWTTMPYYKEKDIISYEDWDIVVINQFSYKLMDPASIENVLDDLLNYINENTSAKIGFLITPAYMDGYELLGDMTSEQCYEKINITANILSKNNCIDFFIPVHKLIQEIRKNDKYYKKGDQLGLTYDKVHSQEGLGCLAQSYMCYLVLANELNLFDGKIKTGFTPNDYVINIYNIPQPHGKCITTTFADKKYIVNLISEILKIEIDII